MNTEYVLSIISLFLSILSLIASAAAVRYTRWQAIYAKKQYELAREEFDTQIQKQRFVVRISDTYYHRSEGYIEFLGILVSINNPTQSSIFVRYLNIKFNFLELPHDGLSIWELLFFRPERNMTELRLPYPPDGSRAGSGIFSVPDEGVPTIWVFDRRTDKLLNFNVPIEIMHDSSTVLWEIIVRVPQPLWEKVKEKDSDIDSVTVIALLTDESIEQAEARFKPRMGLEASDRERVEKLIASTSKLPKE